MAEKGVVTGMFVRLRKLMEDIWNEDSSVTWSDFRKRVETAYENDELSGTEYDWLLNNMAEGYEECD